MFENFNGQGSEKLYSGFHKYRYELHGSEYVAPDLLLDEVAIELHAVYTDMCNAINGHIGGDNEYLRPMVYDNPEWIAHCLRQELNDPRLDAFMLQELERVFSLGIPLATLMDHNWATPTEDGLESLKCDLEDIQEIKAIRKEFPRVHVNQIMSAQWNRKHLRHCEGCEFDAHEPGAEKVNA